jgi:hypothetical protein
VHVCVFGGILDFTLFYEENVIGGIGLRFFWGILGGGATWSWRRGDTLCFKWVLLGFVSSLCADVCVCEESYYPNYII